MGLGNLKGEHPTTNIERPTSSGGSELEGEEAGEGGGASEAGPRTCLWQPPPSGALLRQNLHSDPSLFLPTKGLGDSAGSPAARGLWMSEMPPAGGGDSAS